MDMPNAPVDYLLAHHMAEAELWEQDQAFTDPMGYHYGISAPDLPVHRGPYYERVLLMAAHLGVSLSHYYKWLKDTAKQEMVDEENDPLTYALEGPLIWNKQYEVLHHTDFGVPGIGLPEDLYQRDLDNYHEQMKNWSF